MTSSAVSGTNPYSISAENITSFSTFAVGSEGSNFTILPVELLTFKVREDSENALLNWATLTEMNNEGFRIEKSLNGQHFTNIGFVKGAGNTNKKQKYIYLDKQFSTDSYYRLRQLDFDGETAFSEPVFLEKGKITPSFFVSSNPLSEKIMLRAAGDFNHEKEVSYRMISIEGKLLLVGNARLEAAETDLNKTLGKIGKGVYLLSLNGGAYLKLVKN